MRYMHVCFRMGSMEKAFKELLDSVKVIYIYQSATMDKSTLNGIQ